MGCPNHSLHAHIDLLWPGWVWCTSEIWMGYSSVVCHASRVWATTRPNRSFFLLYGRKVKVWVKRRGWPRDTVLSSMPFVGRWLLKDDWLCNKTQVLVHSWLAENMVPMKRRACILGSCQADLGWDGCEGREGKVSWVELSWVGQGRAGQGRAVE